jgi:hypothetical protein
VKSELTVKRFLGKKGFQTLRRDWQTLAGSVSFRSFYQHPAWFQAYFDRPSGFSDKIEFRCVYQGDRLLAVLPLTYCPRLRGLLSEATLPTSGGLYMPDIVVDDDADKKELWDVMRNPAKSDDAPKLDLFSAKAVLESSTIASFTADAAGNGSVAMTGDRCAFVDIIEYEDAYKALKKNFRGNLNKARNRMNAQDSSEFLLFKKGGDVDAAYDEFVTLEMSGWKGQKENRKGYYAAPAAIALNKSKFLFYKNVVREFAQFDAVEICLLKVNDKTIGAQILILLNETSYMLKTAFDETAKYYSPGHMLTDFAYRRYSSAGRIKTLCFITDYDWHRYWNPRYVNYVNIEDYNKSASGRIGKGALRLQRFLKGI